MLMKYLIVSHTLNNSFTNKDKINIWKKSFLVQDTSFSLIAETLKELGEEDLLGADNELLADAVFCLGLILWYCNACL